MERKHIHGLGVVACLGAFVSVLADLFSGWSSSPNAMTSALSLDLESIRGLFVEKPRWTFVLGNYLGVFFIPFHMLGFVLVYQLLIPAGRRTALTVTGLAFYLIAIGAGYHGTYAFVGDIIQQGSPALASRMLDYRPYWGAAMVTGFLLVSLFLMVLILTGRTGYPKWGAWLSPLPVMAFTSLLAMLLPDSMYGTRAFLTVTGFNLSLLVFFVLSWRVCLVRATGTR